MTCKCGRCNCDEPKRDADGILRNAEGYPVCPVCHVELPHRAGTAEACTAEMKRRIARTR